MALNKYGVKDASDCYRTIKGFRYIAWMSFPSDRRIREYRSVGCRCVRRGDELFMCISDKDLAGKVDAKLGDE